MPFVRTRTAAATVPQAMTCDPETAIPFRSGQGNQYVCRRCLRQANLSQMKRTRCLARKGSRILADGRQGSMTIVQWQKEVHGHSRLEKAKATAAASLKMAEWKRSSVSYKATPVGKAAATNTEKKRQKERREVVAAARAARGTS